LDSILNQSNEINIQIAVSDNASIDGTRDLVEQYSKVYKNIVYYRWDSNKGADLNYLKSVEIATGEYCWLMGSDDLIPEGAIDKVLDFIDDADIYLVDRIEASIKLEYLNQLNWLEVNEKDCVFNFSNNSELIRYFSSCKRLGGLFSYLSSVIVRRKVWNNYPCNQKYIGTLYSHAYILLCIIFNGGKLIYIREPLVVSRGGNDSFLSLHWMQRTLIDLNGYHQLGLDLIDDRGLRELFWSVMKNELSSISVIKTLAVSGFGSWDEYKSLALETYKIPSRVLFLAEILYPFLRTAYIIKNFIKNLIKIN
jgi:abequosyltransferase